MFVQGLWGRYSSRVVAIFKNKKPCVVKETIPKLNDNFYFG
jgi:hypothetical protein